MDWFLYNRDLRHERVKEHNVFENAYDQKVALTITKETFTALASFCYYSH